MIGQNPLTDDEYELIMNRISMKSSGPILFGNISDASSSFFNDDETMQSQRSRCRYFFNDRQYHAEVCPSRSPSDHGKSKDDTHRMTVGCKSNSSDYEIHNKMSSNGTIHGNSSIDDSYSSNTVSNFFNIGESNSIIADILKRNVSHNEHRANFSENNMNSTSVIPNQDYRTSFASPAAPFCSLAVVDVVDSSILDDGDDSDLLRYFGIKVSRCSEDDCAELFNDGECEKEEDGRLLA